MASASPPEALRTGRFDDGELWSEDGLLVEAFGPGWALLCDPDTGEAMVVEGVVHWGSDGEVLEDRDRRALAVAWGTTWRPH